VLFAFRSVAAPGATDADAHAYKKMLKMYPLSEAASPKPTRFVDGRSHPLHTLPFYDIRALEDIHQLVDVEPVQPQDKVMVGLLATIGIERGKPFNPQGKMKVAMERGVKDAYFYMQQMDARLFASSLYLPDRHWSFVMVPDEMNGFEFVTEDKVMMPGRVGTVYLAPAADHGKEALSMVPPLSPRRGILGQVLRAAGRGAGRVENGEILYSRFDSSRAEEFLKRRRRDHARTSSRVSVRQSRRSSWKSRSEHRATFSS
jgi:hypothetical protein